MSTYAYVSIMQLQYISITVTVITAAPSPGLSVSTYTYVSIMQLQYISITVTVITAAPSPGLSGEYIHVCKYYATAIHI